MEANGDAENENMPNKEPMLVSNQKEKTKSLPRIINVEPIDISDDDPDFEELVQFCNSNDDVQLPPPHIDMKMESSIGIMSADSSISTELNSVHNDDRDQQTENQNGIEIDYPTDANVHRTGNGVQLNEKQNDTGAEAPNGDSLLNLIPNQTEKENRLNEINNNGQAPDEDIETAGAHCHDNNVPSTQSIRTNLTKPRSYKRRRNPTISSWQREGKFQKISYLPETDEESGDNNTINSLDSTSDTDSTISPLRFD